jgi:SMI1-KNR4 cell-wall
VLRPIEQNPPYTPPAGTGNNLVATITTIFNSRMSPLDRDRLLAKLNCSPPSDTAAIRQFETESGFRLPDDYAGFLQQTNGGEGFVGNAYVILWRVEDLLEMNDAYQVAEYALGLFLFGSDGGGEAFAFDRRSDANPIVAVPFVGMDLKRAHPVAPNFESFLEKLFKS